MERQSEPKRSSAKILRVRALRKSYGPKVNGERSASVKCPECGSKRIYKAGFRHLKSGISVQRFLCRDCGLRFSEPSKKRQVALERSPKFFESKPKFGDVKTSNILTVKPGLKNSSLAIREDVTSHEHSLHNNTSDRYISIDTHSRDYRVGVSSARGAKNLAEVIGKTTRQAGATKPDPATMKGLLVQFTFYLHKEGYAKDSRYVDCIRMLKNSGANLLDPENVKEIIAKKKWKDGVKMQAVYAYDAMTKMLNITWKKPRYRQQETLPFVPSEKELDQLIAACKGRKLVAFLQTLKETFADPGEALKLRWKDIRDNVITINQPVRGHNPRQLKVSHKLIAMLNALPKTSQYIFNTTYASLGQCFRRVRKRTSSVLQNPRIQEITFTSFRHWGATMVFHQTKSILLVKKLLGHKHIKNTMKYTHLIDFQGDDYDVATATTLEEIKKVITAGFEYVTELKGVKIFRKPKRFNA